MRHIVVGTAGHIDHGKSTLVEALTGTHPDRLEEEQRRGITIELGFADLGLPPDGVVGFVDVPGHERFVRHMVAGAAGFDAAMLMIAADEGVMPALGLSETPEETPFPTHLRAFGAHLVFGVTAEVVRRAVRAAI